jgi:hypothetical protein
MKGRWAELRKGREVTDANWLREAVAKEVNGLKDAMFVVVEKPRTCPGSIVFPIGPNGESPNMRLSGSCGLRRPIR